MKKYLFFVVVIMLIFSACKYSKEYQQVNAGNQFSISVPSWMKKQDDLAIGAPFQYANRFRNFYSMGMALGKDTVKKDFNDLLRTNLDTLKNHLVKPIVTDSTAVNIGGLNGVRVEIYGKMGTENIYFSELLMEGPSKFYHISVWTRGEDRKLKYKDDINGILNSFKPI